MRGCGQGGGQARTFRFQSFSPASAASLLLGMQGSHFLIPHVELGQEVNPPSSSGVPGRRPLQGSMPTVNSGWG